MKLILSSDLSLLLIIILIIKYKLKMKGFVLFYKNYKYIKYNLLMKKI